MTKIEEKNDYIARRYGTFTIPRSMFSTHYHHVEAVLKNIVVVQADNDFATDCIKYVALRASFAPMKQWVMPEYTLEFLNLDAPVSVNPRFIFTT